MKLLFINEDIFEPQKNQIERGESSFIYIYIYIERERERERERVCVCVCVYKAFVFIQRIDKVEEEN